jgi:hypothetical protein
MRLQEAWGLLTYALLPVWWFTAVHLYNLAMGVPPEANDNLPLGLSRRWWPMQLFTYTYSAALTSAAALKMSGEGITLFEFTSYSASSFWNKVFSGESEVTAGTRSSSKVGKDGRSAEFQKMVQTTHQQQSPQQPMQTPCATCAPQAPEPKAPQDIKVEEAVVVRNSPCNLVKSQGATQGGGRVGDR